VLDNRHGRLATRSGAGGLYAILRISDGLLGCAFADLHSLAADIDARIVHHCEHRDQSAIFRPDEFADAGAIVSIAHDTCGGGVDAELVFQADAANIVFRPERTVVLDMIFRHQEQRDAAAALRRARQTRKHQMDDVVSQIMLTPGDIDFLTLNQIFAFMLAVPDRRGGAAQRADVRAGLRFGQVHCAGPLPADEIRQISCFLRLRSVMLQRINRADAQHRQKVERQICAAEVFEHIAGEREGKALPAEFFR